MKRIAQRITGKLLAVAVLATLVAGCSDGSLGSRMQDFSISPAAPIIISFYAEPDQLKAGESTTVSWEVAGADTVEITAVSSGAPLDFHVTTDELSGSAVAANLTATTDFILTATKQLAVTEGEEPAEGADEAAIVSSWVQISRSKAQEAEGEDEGVPAVVDPTASSVTQTITVTVTEVAELSIKSFQADKESLTAGERTVLRWEVEPAEGVDVVVESTDPDEVIAATDQCDGSVDDITVAGEPGVFPAVGCAVVAPLGRTTYAISAAMTDDPSVSDAKDLVIDVIEQHLQVVSFTIDAGAGKQENAVVLNYNDPITLEWQVTPAEAVVSISADTEVKECDLTQEQAATGSLRCTPTGDTTFTLVAKLGDMTSDPRVATVTKRTSGSADIKIMSDGWAFAGEEVEVEVEPVGNPEMITKIVIRAAETIEISGFAGQARIARKVVVPPGRNVKVEWECPDCGVPQRDVVAVSSISMAPKVFYDGQKPLPITRIVPDPKLNGDFYYGVKRAGYAEGKAFLYRSKTTGMTIEEDLLSISFGEALMGINNIGKYINPTFLEKMEYPVGGIGVAEDGRIYAGISGAMMYKDEGSDWKLFDSFFGYADRKHTYPGSHPTCAGETQKGNKAQGDPTIATFHQFCDILTFGDKGLMVATDRGVFTDNDADAYLSDRNENPHKGIPPAEQTYAAGDEYLTFSRVANDLERAGDVIFVATSKGSGTAEGGVFKTSDFGDTWEEFGLEGTNVYSVIYDGQSKKLYAGTAEGVQVSPVDSASWEAVGSLSKPVFSLAIDPYSAGTGVLMAGTDDGIAILRGIGVGDFVSIESESDNGLGKVRGLAIASKVDDTAGTIQHFLSIGTAKGVISGDVAVRITGVIDTSDGVEDAADGEETSEE